MLNQEQAQTHGRQRVDSSQIVSIGYSSELRKLEIEFKTGSVYVYDNITPEIHSKLMAADSIGKFFGQNIKPFPDAFPFTKIAEPFSKREQGAA